MPEQQLPFHHAKRCYRQRLWETGEGADACIVIAGFKIPVHAPVLEEESSYFQSQFRRSFQESGRLEFHFDIENVNTVWRILELIYLGTYSNKLYPLSCLSDEGNELSLHGSIYRLAVSWGLSNNLQEIIFRKYKNTVENSWEPVAFLESISIIFSPLRENGTVPAPGASIIASDCLNPNRLHEDRIAQLIIHQLETKRGTFKEDLSIMLCRSLQNSPVLLRLFLQRWLVARGES